MSKTEKERVHEFKKNQTSTIMPFGHIDNHRRDLSCSFVGGTTIVGKSEPMKALEPVSRNHDEAEVMRFIKELTVGNSGNLIEPLWPVRADKHNLQCCSINTSGHVDGQKPMVELERVFNMFPVEK